MRCNVFDVVAATPANRGYNSEQAIYKTLEAGAKHPDYSTALQTAESLARKRNFSREDIVPTR